MLNNTSPPKNRVADAGDKFEEERTEEDGSEEEDDGEQEAHADGEGAEQGPRALGRNEVDASENVQEA